MSNQPSKKPGEKDLGTLEQEDDLSWLTGKNNEEELPASLEPSQQVDLSKSSSEAKKREMILNRREALRMVVGSGTTIIVAIAGSRSNDRVLDKPLQRVADSVEMPSFSKGDSKPEKEKVSEYRDPEKMERLKKQLHKKLKAKGYHYDSGLDRYVHPMYKKFLKDEPLVDFDPEKFGYYNDGQEIFRPNTAPFRLVKPAYDAFMRANAKKIKDGKGPIKLNSADRGLVHQAMLREDPRYEVVAKPGDSVHNIGMAVDVANYAESRPYLVAEGFHTGIANDLVHFQYQIPINTYRAVLAQYDAKARKYLEEHGLGDLVDKAKNAGKWGREIKGKAQDAAKKAKDWYKENSSKLPWKK